MALKYRLLLSDARVTIGSASLLIGVILGAIFSYLYISPTNYDGPTPLHTNVYFGIDSVGSWTTLYWYAGVILILALVHIIGSLYLFDHSRRRALTWLYIGVMVQALLLYAFWRVLHLA